ncbi:MAG: P-loop NTPase [Myxococcota bacterium]|nr:P-loop NTPase [Myxococcota bacterium]
MPELGEPPLLEDVESARQRVASALRKVPRIVAVASGKGGVGKSAVAVNLAVALARQGSAVGLFDADLHGPSVAQMLGLRGQPVRLDPSDALVPIEGPLGLRVQSMDFFLQGNQPLDWDGDRGEGATLRSAMEQAALADLLGQTAWGERDVLVIDLAPGSDRLPALARWLPERLGALAVTIPTEVAMLAVERSLRRAWTARVPLIGLVENCASATCSACGAEGPLYREASVDVLAAELAVEVVARLPFDAGLAHAADRGEVFLEGPGADTAVGRAFAELARRVSAWEPSVQEERSW